MSPLIFLLKLGWDCRYRLPLLITVGFMLLDIRMQLDINVQTRRIPRRRVPHQPVPGNDPAHANDANGDSPDDRSDDSWTTIDEEEEAVY